MRIWIIEVRITKHSLYFIPVFDLERLAPSFQCSVSWKMHYLRTNSPGWGAGTLTFGKVYRKTMRKLASCTVLTWPTLWPLYNQSIECTTWNCCTIRMCCILSLLWQFTDDADCISLLPTLTGLSCSHFNGERWWHRYMRISSVTFSVSSFFYFLFCLSSFSCGTSFNMYNH